MLQTFVQSFSQGQITIPKKFRDELNLDSVFWLKLMIDNQKRIIAEPVGQLINKSDYLNTLTTVDGSWFDVKDYNKTRSDIKKRINKNDTNTG